MSIDRPIVSAGVDERDVFGAGQQSEFILMTIPVAADPAEKAGVLTRDDAMPGRVEEIDPAEPVARPRPARGSDDVIDR